MRDTFVVVCAATSATTTAPARISHWRRMLPSRVPLSHPRRDGSLPCPRSADSTTATSAAQRSRGRRTLARRRREQRARSALARRSCCRLRDRHALMLKSVAGAKGWSSAHLDCSHDRYRRSRIFVVRCRDRRDRVLANDSCCPLTRAGWFSSFIALWTPYPAALEFPPRRFTDRSERAGRDERDGARPEAAREYPI